MNFQTSGSNGRSDVYALTDLGIVSALGIGVAETEWRMFAGDTSGMKPIDGLVGGDSTVFGFAPLPPEEFAAAPTRVGALIDAALRQLEPAIEALKREVPVERIGAVIGTSNSTMEEFTDNPYKCDMAYPAERIREKLGLGGPCWSVSTACSSSARTKRRDTSPIPSGLPRRKPPRRRRKRTDRFPKSNPSPPTQKNKKKRNKRLINRY